MRSIFWKAMFCFCVVLRFAVLAAMAQDLPPRTQYVHAISDIEGMEPPVIDGFLDDEAWTKTAQGPVTSTNIAHFNWIVKFRSDLAREHPAQSGVVEGSEVPADDADLSYRVFATHDDEYLYIAVAVFDLDYVQRLAPGSEDGETWKEDSVEIFIDGDHSASPANLTKRPEEYATGGQFVFSSNGARRDVEAGDPSFGEDGDWFASVFENETFDGFDYEFKFRLSKIGNPEKGDTIGFNIAVNDADDPSASDSKLQLRWTGKAHDESTYGDLIFGRREITAPLTTDTITVDGKLDEPAWSSAGRDPVNSHTGAARAAVYPLSLDDLSFEIFTLHDEQFLYIAVDVTDDQIRTDTGPAGSEGEQIWHDDSVEFMFDGDLNRSSSTENVYGMSAKFMMSANTATTYDESQFFLGADNNDISSDWFAAPSINKKGYTIELRVLKAAIIPDPENITQIGLNIAVNEDDNDATEGDRDTQLRWNGNPNNERSYGILILGGPSTPVESWELH